MITADSLACSVVRRVHHYAHSHLDILADFNTVGNDAGTDTKGQFDLPKLERVDLDVATVAFLPEKDVEEHSSRSKRDGRS